MSINIDLFLASLVVATLGSVSGAHSQALASSPVADIAPLQLKIDAAVAKADVAVAVAAAVPPVCNQPPPSDTVSGSAGTLPPCVRRADATGATLVMPSTATTIDAGAFSGLWPTVFPSMPTTAFAQARTTTDPYTCQVGVVTTAGYAGKCWKLTQKLILPSNAVELLKLQLTTADVAPAGIVVNVVGRQ